MDKDTTVVKNLPEINPEIDTTYEISTTKILLSFLFAGIVFRLTPSLVDGTKNLMKVLGQNWSKMKLHQKGLASFLGSFQIIPWGTIAFILYIKTFEDKKNETNSK